MSLPFVLDASKEGDPSNGAFANRLRQSCLATYGSEESAPLV